MLQDISDSTALLALQGPRAQEVLQQALPRLDFTVLKPFALIRTNISDFGEDRADKKEKEKEKEKAVRKKQDNFKQQEQRATKPRKRTRTRTRKRRRRKK